VAATTAGPPGPEAGDPGAAGPRNRYADLLRVLAISLVVLGHWLLTSVSYRGGQLSGASVMAAVGWSGWATLLFQVMPVFFLVGGYANALSWTRHRAGGATWAQWVRHRALRLLRPTTVFVGVVVTAVAAGSLLGADPAELALAAWGVALQLWFLPVYLLLIALTPALHAAHRRWGLAVPAVLALGAAGVDAGLLGARLPGIGYANYLLVWGTMH
jgi:fucose 4-O-acetylase-like acetyltransferase